MLNFENDPSSIFDLEELHQGNVKSVLFKLEMDSTNDLAVKLLQQNTLKLPAIILTEMQRAGRGRGNNQWITSEGALTFSLVLPPNSQLQLTLLSLVAGLSIVRMLETDYGLQPELKWPNDVLVTEKKIAGILIETKPNGWIVGVGINVNNILSLDSATSLREQLGQQQDLQKTVSRQIQHFYATQTLAFEQPQQFVEQCEKQLAFLGEEIELVSGSQTVIGKLEGLDRSGGLNVQTTTGVQTIHSATRIRPKR